MLRSEVKIVCAGVVMVVFGLILFYTIQTKPGIEDPLRIVRHSGTFVGLMGIGVSIAGMLLYLINRNQPPLSENFDQ